MAKGKDKEKRKFQGAQGPAGVAGDPRVGVVHFTVFNADGDTVDRIIVDSDSLPDPSQFVPTVTATRAHLRENYPPGKYAVIVVSSSSKNPISLEGTSGTSKVSSSGG